MPPVPGIPEPTLVITCTRSRLAGFFDKYVVDGMVNLAGWLVKGSSSIAGLNDRYIVDGAVNGAASLAQGRSFWLLALGLLGAVMSVAAAVGTLRAIYLQSPPDESRRSAGARLPLLTRLSTAAAVAVCVAIAGYGVFASPIISLADQGAEALGLR